MTNHKRNFGPQEQSSIELSTTAKVAGGIGALLVGSFAAVSVPDAYGALQELYATGGAMLGGIGGVILGEYADPFLAKRYDGGKRRPQ